MTVDLASVTREMFEAHRGETFTMRVAPEETIALELIATEPLPTPASAKRGSFLVRFRTSTPHVMPQKIYTLEHPAMGTLEIFLVPVGPDSISMRYDAVFS